MDHGPALDAIISDCLVNNVWSSALARLRLELPALSLCMCLIHSWLHFHYPLQNHYKIHQWVHNSWSYLWRELRLLWGTRPFVEPVECTAKQKEWYLIFKKTQRGTSTISSTAMASNRWPTSSWEHIWQKASFCLQIQNMAEIKILCFSLGVIRNEYIRGSVNVRCFENKSIGQTEMDRYRRGLVNTSVQGYGFWKCQAGEWKGDQDELCGCSGAGHKVRCFEKRQCSQVTR